MTETIPAMLRELLREIRDTLHAVHRLLQKADREELARRAAETRARLDKPPAEPPFVSTRRVRPVHVRVDTEGHIRVTPALAGEVSNGILTFNEPILGQPAPIDIPWR